MIHGVNLFNLTKHTVMAYCLCGRWATEITMTQLSPQQAYPLWSEVEFQFAKHLRDAMHVQLVPLLGDAS